MSENKEYTLKAFGNHIKNMRIGKKMTQVEVSARMNRDQQSLQRVESGRVNPSLTYIIELAEALDLEIVELLHFNTSKK